LPLEQFIVVEPTQARLLATIDGHTIPAATYPRQLLALHYGDEDLTPYAVSLTFEGISAVIACELPLSYATQNNRDRGAPLLHLWSQPLRGRTELGEAFEARAAYSVGMTAVSGPGLEGSGTRVTVRADDWHLARAQPCLWAGSLVGDLPEGPGNLHLRIGTPHTGGSMSRGHFGLVGSRWTYFLLKKGKRRPHHTLVVDTAGQALDPVLLGSELRVLSYCLGQPLHCGFLVGLDAHGETVAYAGGEYGFLRLRPNHEFPPVPQEYFRPWFTLLFQHLTQHLEVPQLRARNEVLYEAITLYVESAAEINNTSREVKALLACLAVAHWFVGPAPGLVAAPAKWARWVRTSPIVRAHAQEGRAELLRTRLEVAAQPGPVELLHLALAEAGLAFPQELREAVQMSSQLATGQVVGAIAYADSQPRCLHLRTLCAGLLATAVGYRGPVAEWDAPRSRRPTGETRSDGWFPTDPAVRPPQFVAEATEHLAATPLVELWPTFERPVVPAGSLVQLLENFARSLASRAGELVRARVVPLPVLDPEAPRLYDFVLESVPVPLASTVLFTVQQAGPGAPLAVLSWDEEGPVIADERALAQFLGQVARAPRTRHAVERLLLLAPDAR